MTVPAVALTTKTQEAIDRFYLQQGPCCAGCDWWGHINSLIGECRKSAPVSGEQRYSMVRMDWNSYRFRDQEAGHILTNREHHCGDFKDDFDWPSLRPAYLRRIGWQSSQSHGRDGVTDSAASYEAAKPVASNEQDGNARCEDCGDKLPKTVCYCREGCFHVESSAAGMAQDAARYRWLRDNGRCDSKHWNGAEIGDRLKAKVSFRYWIEPADVDAAIDAALRAVPHQQGERE